MAFTTLLITVSMVTIASAGWPAWPGADNPYHRYHSPMLRFGPPTPPSLLGMPTFAPNFPFFQLPVFPTFPRLPSVADIVKGGTSPNGGSFTGVVITSKSEAKRKDDGTVVHEGGSTIVTNNNGEVHVTKTGKAPPEVELPTAAPPRDSYEPKINKHMSSNNRKTQDTNHNFGTRFRKPGPAASYVGSSFSLVQSSSYNNGKFKRKGSIDIYENNNGRVKHQHIPLHRDDSRS